MSFKLRQIELTAAGREIVRDTVVDKAVLTVGRQAQSDIHLPDLAIEPEHATIAVLGGGRIEVKAAGTLGFAVDGSTTTGAVIDTNSGAELRFGSYRITVSRDDGAVLLTIQQAGVEGAQTGDLEEKNGFSLAGALPGKRVLSWVLGLLVLGLFLAFPIISHQTRDADSKATVLGDASWSTGKLSLAHHGLEDKCESCHVKAFEAVRDETCVTCHENTHDHAQPARLAKSREGGPLGPRMLDVVAHTFGKPGAGSCADCHTEHEGMDRMELPAQAICSDCHTDLKSQLPDTKLGNASDFGKLHPQFTPSVITDPATRKLTPIPLDKMARENSGLTFPHKLHLDKKGGVARMAGNIGSELGYESGGLQCKDCHRPTEEKIRFKPINMERDCEGCHSLAYDKVGSIFRRLRHGDVEQTIADLTVANPARTTVSNRRRPGNYAAGGPYYFNFSATAYNSLLIRKALSRDGICGECHTPLVKNGKPGVMPVTLVTRYMHQGWFDHKPHAQETCTSCHTAEKSSFSSDLLLPDVKQCRTCHLGEDAVKAEVPSGCAMCHDYHPAARESEGLKPNSS